jgi:hypothetical protein
VSSYKLTLDAGSDETVIPVRTDDAKLGRGVCGAGFFLLNFIAAFLAVFFLISYNNNYNIFNTSKV